MTQRHWTDARPVKVLVVDDEPELVSLIHEWLESEHYEPYSAKDGKEALQLFSQHRPSLIITDLLMPGIDGFQLISLIRSMSNIPIIVLTAFGSEEHEARAAKLGADAFFVKPVQRSTFLLKVCSLLSK